MKQIPLTRGQVALVDNEDFARISEHKWFAHKDRHGYYGKRHVVKKGVLTCTLMHREIMGALPGQIIDHEDTDSLNNQKYNLRFCTSQQNQMNSKSRKGTSKFKGVHLPKNNDKWIAHIAFNRKYHYLGCFSDEVEAAKAYDKKAVELFGEFARTNF